MHRIAEQTAEREKASHGDIFLPVNSYHCLVPLTYRELALHWHEEMEITLIREGMSDYRVGQSSFRTLEGDIILIPPYCTHSAFEIPGKTMVSDSLVFHLDLLGAQGQDLSAAKYLRPLAEGQLQMPALIRLSDKGYDEIRKAFLEALDCFQNRPPFYEMWPAAAQDCTAVHRRTLPRKDKSSGTGRYERIQRELFHELLSAVCRNELHLVY